MEVKHHLGVTGTRPPPPPPITPPPLSQVWFRQRDRKIDGDPFILGGPVLPFAAAQQLRVTLWLAVMSRHLCSSFTIHITFCQRFPPPPLTFPIPPPPPTPPPPSPPNPRFTSHSASVLGWSTSARGAVVSVWRWVSEERGQGRPKKQQLVTVTTVGRFQNYVIIYSASGWVRGWVCEAQ